jgi:hypothetical protein
MRSRSFIIATLIVSASGYSAAQHVTSQRATIAISARVAPMLKVRPVTSFVKHEGGEIAVMNRSENEMEIIATVGGDATEVEIPVSVTTNMKSFLFRLSSVSGPVDGHVSLSSSSRNLPIENNRVFALVSTGSPVNGRIESVRLHFDRAADGQKREVRMVVQAVTTQATSTI